jgi:hypothetical protein
MFDGDDPEKLIHEFLLALFGPGIGLLVLVWASFRIAFDGALTSMGLEPITPAPGGGAIASEFGRFLLLVVVTAVLMLPYLGLYVRVLRGPLRERGLV